MANKRAQYLLLDFDDLTEVGLKTLIAEFEKQGQKLVDFSANNRVTRKDGQQLKKFTMFFDSGQSITLTVNSTGDLVQAKLNSTVLPINSPKSERELATDLSNKIERNQERFEKSLAAKAQRAINDDSKKRTAKKTSKQLLGEVQEAHAAAQSSIKLLEDEKAKMQEKLLQSNNQAADYRSQLEKEKAITNDLLDQLEELGVTPNV